MVAYRRAGEQVTEEKTNRPRVSGFDDGQREQVISPPVPDVAVLRRTVADPRRASSRAMLTLQRSYGNRAVSGLIQTKLIVGAAGDEYEREADRVAEQVVSGPAPTAQSPVQRQAEDEEELLLKPIGRPVAEEVDPAVEERLNRLRGGGEPLPSDVRTEMEARFGVDFGEVRVHADTEAAELSRELRAQAFTSGTDVYFSAGRYDPTSGMGKKLLAHELTHVVQQRGRHTTMVQRKQTAWEYHNMTEEEWNRLSVRERTQKIQAFAQAQSSTLPVPARSTRSLSQGRISSSSLPQTTSTSSATTTEAGLLEDRFLEDVGGIAGHWGFSTAGLGLGVAGDVFGGIEDYYDKDWAGKTSAGFGIAGGILESLGGLAEFSGQLAGGYRGYRLLTRGGRAGRLLGRRMMRRAAWGGTQNLIGVGTGAAGIISGSAALSGNEDLSKQADKASAGLQIAGESIGLLSGLKSLLGAQRRSSRARSKTYSSDEMKALAEFVASNQGKGSKALGALSNVGGIVGGAFRMAGGKAGLIGGAIAGGLGSLIGIGQSIYSGRRQKKAEREAAQHVDYLVNKLRGGDAEAISFAQDVLDISATEDELREMADHDVEALKELLKQKMVKYE